MADDSSLDYKALFQREAELRRQAEEKEQQAKDREQQAKDREQQAKDREQQAKDREQQEAELRRQAEARTQPTSFREFIQACHDLFSQKLGVGTPTKSTKGHIPTPTGKYCPTRLCFWAECPAQQRELYDTISSYLQPAEQEPARLFASLAELHGLSRRFSRRLLRSEKDLESYERFAVEDHVHDIIAELCKIPEAQERFQLGDGVVFDNHANGLDDSDDNAEVLDVSTSQNLRADQFCIHRVDSSTSTLLTTVKYKPPHKLSVENL